MTALLLAATFACGAALPAMAEQATPETAAQPDPTEWADEAQDVTEAEEAPVCISRLMRRKWQRGKPQHH